MEMHVHYRIFCKVVKADIFKSEDDQIIVLIENVYGQTELLKR